MSRFSGDTKTIASRVAVVRAISDVRDVRRPSSGRVQILRVHERRTATRRRGRRGNGKAGSTTAEKETAPETHEARCEIAADGTGRSGRNARILFVPENSLHQVSESKTIVNAWPGLLSEMDDVKL